MHHRPSEAGHPENPRLKPLEFGAGVDIPKADEASERAGECTRSVRKYVQRPNRLATRIDRIILWMPLKAAELCASFHIPHARRSVLGAGHHPAAIWQRRQGPHCVRVTLKAAHSIASVEAP